MRMSIVFLALSIWVAGAGHRACGSDFGSFRGLSSGWVFATVAESVRSNPASLVQSRSKVTRLSAATSGGSSWSFEGTLASASERFGMGAAVSASQGYDGFALGSGSVGVGMGADGLSLGANASVWLGGITSGSISPDIGASMMIGRRGGFQLGVMVDSLQSEMTRRLAVGGGYAASGRYQIEVSISHPMTPEDLIPRPNQLMAGVVMYAGQIAIGVYGAASTESQSSFKPTGYGIGAGAALRMSQSWSLDARIGTTGTTTGMLFGLTYRR